MNSEQTANILAFYSYYNPQDNVDAIADDFKIPASLIVNGLFWGEQNGLFTSDRKGAFWKNITTTKPPEDTANFGKDIDRVKAMMMETITNLNGVKEDILDENLFIWVGAPLIVSKVCLQLLTNEGKLKAYWIRDLKDIKSKYYYHTLPENVEKKFAKINFKHQNKKNGKKNEHLPPRKR